MAKRFTDSGKWLDAWFMDLPSKYKLFWLYLLDNCNHAGIWKVNFKVASFHIGEHLEYSEVKRIVKDRILFLNDEYWYISKFIKYQYKTDIQGLNPKNKAHLSIIKLLNDYEEFKPLTSPLLGVKDKDKDKDKEKDLDILSNNLKKEIKKEKSFDVDSIQDVTELEKHYKNNEKIIRAVLSNKKNGFIDRHHLLEKLSNFTLYLTENGRLSESFKEYSKYFLNWSRKHIEIKQKELGFDNLDNEKIITFRSNVNPQPQRMKESDFLKIKERNEKGGYIYEIIKTE